MNRRFFLSLLGASPVFYGCSRPADEPGLTGADLSKFKPVANGIRRASSLILYEGLPHQGWEREQLEKELATKKTIRLHDYHFYEHPLTVAREEIEFLRRLSAAERSYTTFSDHKRCGGYHPDYGLRWKDGDVHYDALICFGCHEMKLYGPKSELLVDIRRGVFDSFESALKKHQGQRPPRK